KPGIMVQCFTVESGSILPQQRNDVADLPLADGIGTDVFGQCTIQRHVSLFLLQTVDQLIVPLPVAEVRPQEEMAVLVFLESSGVHEQRRTYRYAFLTC